MLEKADLKTIGELIDQGIQTFAQSQGLISGASKTASEIVMEDVATGERLTKQAASEEGINYMNIKNTHEAYVGINLEAIGRNRSHFDKMLTSAQGHTERLQALSEQALENCILRDNLVNNNSALRSNLINSQSAAHRDIATNEQYNLSEQNWLVASALRSQGVSESVIAGILARLTEDDSE